MIFTNTDKTLMMRAGRLLVEQARILKHSYGQNWAGSAEAKEAKRQHDRLLRDDRDLRELAKRLEIQSKINTEKLWHDKLLQLPGELRLMYLEGTVNADGTYKENPNGKVCLGGKLFDPETLSPEQLKHSAKIYDPSWDENSSLYAHG